MAEATRSIFNKKAMDRLRSPDDLDKFVQVTNPSVWAVMAACIVLLAGLFAWGVFGSVSTNVSDTGVVIDGTAMCFLDADDASKVNVSDSAYVDGVEMQVAEMTSVPLSRDEAGKILNSDYLVSALFPEDWGYHVTFDGDTSDLENGVPLTVSITTSRKSPISLVLGGNA